MKKSLCAVVPAAGRGTRLGMEVPKVFVSILPTRTIWEALHEPLAEIAERIVLILSPEGREYLTVHLGGFSETAFSQTEACVQESPRGMGDAIFGAADLWRDYDNLLIVWGDQFNLSAGTLRACLTLHEQAQKPALTFPVVRADRPYVEYVFDPSGRLTEVRQTREGDVCAPGGFSDVGVFLISGGTPLLKEWERYEKQGGSGAATGEINFLPFLVHLSRAGWPVRRHECPDVDEALGINTPEDLARARIILEEKLRKENP